MWPVTVSRVRILAHQGLDYEHKWHGGVMVCWTTQYVTQKDPAVRVLRWLNLNDSFCGEVTPCQELKMPSACFSSKSRKREPSTTLPLAKEEIASAIDDCFYSYQRMRAKCEDFEFWIC